MQDSFMAIPTNGYGGGSTEVQHACVTVLRILQMLPATFQAMSGILQALMTDVFSGRAARLFRRCQRNQVFRR